MRPRTTPSGIPSHVIYDPDGELEALWELHRISRNSPLAVLDNCYTRKLSVLGDVTAQPTGKGALARMNRLEFKGVVTEIKDGVCEVMVYSRNGLFGYRKCPYSWAEYWETMKTRRKDYQRNYYLNGARSVKNIKKDGTNDKKI